jgi:hypothetical protein
MNSSSIFVGYFESIPAITIDLNLISSRFGNEGSPFPGLITSRSEFHECGIWSHLPLSNSLSFPIQRTSRCPGHWTACLARYQGHLATFASRYSTKTSSHLYQCHEAFCLWAQIIRSPSFARLEPWPLPFISSYQKHQPKRIQNRWRQNWAPNRSYSWTAHEGVHST